MAQLAGRQRATFICTLMLVNCCLVSADGNDNLSEAEAAYRGEISSTEDLLESGEEVEAVLNRQVKIVGDTSIMATLRTFGQGGDLFQISDKDSGVGMVFGTDSTQKHMRLKPTKGSGIGIHSAKDAVGVFVDAATGKVGIGHDAPEAELHVKGTTYSSGTITSDAGGQQAALLLSGVSNYNGIQFGRDGQEQYLIGRGGSLEERQLSFSIPSLAAYGGGKQPRFKWVSGDAHTSLAELEGETGNMFIKGRLGIGATHPKTELDVRGSINIENAKGEAVVTFPKGDGGFSIRSSDNPAQTKDSDSRFYISGKNGFTGIGTSKPKAMLDVRGTLNLQDASGSAVMYFPQNGKKANFYLRCADDPSKYNPGQERLFVGSNGLIGIGTSTPTHGLTLDSPAAPGSKQHDVSIPKGSLHLAGAVYDVKSNGKYFLDLKKGGFIKALNVQSSLGVGTAKPIGAIPGSAVIHIQDPKAALVRIENTAPGGSATLQLEVQSSKWSMTGTQAAFKISHNNHPRLSITADGKIGVGTSAPSHGLTVSSSHAVGHPNNDLAIPKGDLWIGGSIKQMPDEKGNSKYSLYLDKTGGLVKNVNVDGKLGIGLAGAEPEFNLELGVDKVFSLGKQMFFSGETASGYISANMYRKDGKWALSKSDAGGAVVALKTGGEIEISGTVQPGTTQLTTMMTINAASQVVAFPLRGVKAGFGTSAPQFPIHVVGAAAISKETQASIAFGATETSLGFLGADEKAVFMGTKDGQQSLSIDQSTGYVGIGTGSPQSALHIASSKTASMSFGSTLTDSTRAFVKAEPKGDGVDMVIGVDNPKDGNNKLSFKFDNTITFAGAGATVFARGDTTFKSGNVGIGDGQFDPNFKLHVIGDAKIEGRVFVSKKRLDSKPPPMVAATSAAKPEQLVDHLDLSDLLEEDEGGSEDEESSAHNEAIDVVDTMSKMSKIIRKQMKQMKAHDDRISILMSQMEMLSKA